LSRVLVEVADGDDAGDFELELELSDDDTVFEIECVATSLNPDFELAKYRTEAVVLEVTSDISPDS
jgi:hypothetical protein